jgi:hypothetical protein
MAGLDPQGYESAEQLARDLRVNARSLRAILRKHSLVPGHEEPDGTLYVMTREVAERVAKNSHVMALPRQDR